MTGGKKNTKNRKTRGGSINFDPYLAETDELVK